MTADEKRQGGEIEDRVWQTRKEEKTWHEKRTGVEQNNDTHNGGKSNEWHNKAKEEWKEGNSYEEEAVSKRRRKKNEEERKELNTLNVFNDVSVWVIN